MTDFLKGFAAGLSAAGILGVAAMGLIFVVLGLIFRQLPRGFPGQTFRRT
jgi:hypothetical protein